MGQDGWNVQNIRCQPHTHLFVRATPPLTSTMPLRTTFRAADAVWSRSGHRAAMASFTNSGTPVAGIRALAVTPVVPAEATHRVEGRRPAAMRATPLRAPSYTLAAVDSAAKANALAKDEKAQMTSGSRPHLLSTIPNMPGALWQAALDRFALAEARRSIAVGTTWRSMAGLWSCLHAPAIRRLGRLLRRHGCAGRSS